MSDEGYLETWLRQLLGHGSQRQDTHEALLLRPDNPPPVLLQGAANMATVALALELLRAIQRSGGSALPLAELEPLRDTLRQSFAPGQWAHLEEEVLRTLLWLERSLSHPKGEDELPLSYPIGPRRILINEAIAEGQDLYVEFTSRTDFQLHRLRLRPRQIEALRFDWQEQEAPLEALSGQRIPDGLPIELALEQLRWVMKIKRLSRIEEATLAKVLPFHSPERGPGE